jgi:hypothetical protein
MYFHPDLAPLFQRIGKGSLSAGDEAQWAQRLSRHEARRRMADEIAALIGRLYRMAELPDAQKKERTDVLCRLLHACLGSSRAVAQTLKKAEAAADAARSLKGAPRSRNAGLDSPSGGGTGLGRKRR